MKKVVLLTLIIIALLLSACRQAQVDSAAKTPTTIPAKHSATPFETAVSTETPTPEAASPTSPPTVTSEFTSDQYPTVIQLGDPLPDEQPWLLVELDWEPYLISEDGEHLIEITIPEEFSPYAFLRFNVSPHGDQITFTASVEGSTRDLYIWDLRKNTITLITELVGTCERTEGSSEECDDLWLSTGDIAWSHDGNMFAFTGAHLGASTDLYVYEVTTGKSIWLTSGPALAVNPVWSPDDAYILHAGVEHLYYGYSGFGYSGWQFYSAAPDGSKIHTLAAGMTERGEEDYLGWVSDRQMLMQSDSWCGGYDLRMMNILSGEEYFIWREYYDSIAYSPEAGLALVFIHPDSDFELEDCGPTEIDPGLYLLTIPDGQFTAVPFDEINLISFDLYAFDGKMPFYMQKNGDWYTVDAEGNIEKYNGNPTLPEQFQKYDSRIDHIYGWVSSAGLEINE